MSTHDLTPEDLTAITEVDRLVHEPARLSILALLHVVDSADFNYVKRLTGLTRGNLSSHISKLEAAGYLQVDKQFENKVPRTLLSLTPQGKEAFQAYRTRLQQVLAGLPE